MEAFMEFSSAEKIDQDLQNNMQYYNLRLRDQSLRDSYTTFMEKSESLSSYQALNRLIGLISVPFLAMIIVRFARKASDEEFIHLVCTAIALVVINAALWAVYFSLSAMSTCAKQKRFRQKPADANETIDPDKIQAKKRFLKHCFMVAVFCFHAFNCYRLVLKAVMPACSNDNRIDNWDCNPTRSNQTLPVDSTLIVMQLPIMYAVTMHGADFTFTIFIWLFTVVSLLFSTIYSHAIQSAVMIGVFILVSVVLIMEVHRQSYALFFTHRKLSDALKERQQAADEENATEMRHMIANVAHDLKTPLASFVNGIEFINQVIEEIETKKSSGDTVTTEDLEDSLNCISQSTQNMKNTNSFMLMTINRCIDYTKASNNMKLVPKYETIDLVETLDLPMNCMKDIQSRINIVLRPIDAEICMYIITDKQWLQENVLCLLSNAVKYSLEGAVTITVTKVTGPGKKASSASSRSGSQQSSSKSGIKNAIYEMQRNKSYSKDLLRLESYRSGQAHAKLEVYDEKDDVVEGDVEELDNTSTGSSSSKRRRRKGSMLSLHSVEEGNEEADTGGSPDSNTVPKSSLGPAESLDDIVVSPETVKQSPKLDDSAISPSHSVDVFDESSDDANKAEYLKIEIEDHGIGLSDEAMTTLFSPFRQAQRLAGGTGLGLFSLAKRIEALEGFCGVKRRRDGQEGSLFWFSIPYRPDTILSNALNQASQNALPPRGLSIPRLMTIKKASMHRLSTQSSNTHLNSGSGEVVWKASMPKHSSNVQLNISPVNTASSANHFFAHDKLGSDASMVLGHSSASSKSNPSGAPKLEHLDVLIVDDSPTILKTTTMMLKRAKHNVTTAINGAEAIKKVMERLNSNSSMFDVILMDLQMPVMDGLEATRRIRHLESTNKPSSGSTSSNKGLLGRASSITAMFRADSKITPSLGAHINIIGVSANSDPETSATAYKMGVDAFIAKPFTLDAFNATYEQIIALQSTTLY